MEWLSKALELLKLPIRYVWAIVIASGLLLFLPDRILQRVRAEKFVKDFGVYIGLAFVIFAVVLVVHLISAAYTTIRAWMQRNKRLSEALLEMLKLDPSEKSVLRDDTSTGSVIDAQLSQSTGSSILDQATISAFRRWRFKPGTYSPFLRIPITWTLEGAQVSAYTSAN